MDRGSENKFIDISDSEINISCCGHSSRIKRRRRRHSRKTSLEENLIEKGSDSLPFPIDREDC